MPTHMPRVGRLPLTPPEIWGQYPNSAGGFCSTAPGFYPPNESFHASEAYEKFTFGKHGQNLEHYSEMTQYAPQGYNAATARHDYNYGPIGAPRLPSLPSIHTLGNVTEKQMHRHSISQVTVREQPKEEKPTGGVAAHLDYEMDYMVDFVAEMAQGMYDLFETRLCFADIDVSRSVKPSSPVTTDFRRYVSQILTSTRLPSSTILLALHYLGIRISILQNKGIYISTATPPNNMLTTALMLASKFLDDNTFQNRSWAEVSRIPVAELNKLEREWLIDIAWNLHFDDKDPLGFSGWLDRWEHFCVKKAAELSRSMEALKLTPVDTVRMQYRAPQYTPLTPMYTPPSTETQFSSGGRERTQNHWQQWPVRDLSPPSAGTSGPTTPEWYKHNVMGFNQHSMTYSNRPLPPLQIVPSNHSPFYGGYPSQFTPSPWNQHGNGCGCGYCTASHERYHPIVNYGMQAVMG